MTTITSMNQMRAEKVCSFCKELKPRDEFPIKRGTKYRQPACKECYPEYRKQLRARSQAAYQAKRHSPIAVEREKVPHLPIGPIQEWLIQLGVPMPDMKRKKGETDGRTQEVADFLGVDARQIYRWRTGESKRTSLDVVDAALCHAGRPEKLREWYPELWEFDGENSYAA